MAKSFVIFLFCVFAARCTEQSYLPGSCPKLSPMSPFDLKKFSGLWNQQESFGATAFGSYGECSAAKYTVTPGTEVIQIVYGQRVVFDGRIETTNGKGIMPDRLTARMFIYYYLRFYGIAVAELLVLATDYDRYAILYSCTEIVGGYSSASWIMTRKDDLKNDPSQAAIDQDINTALARFGLSRSNYVTHNNHGKCNDFKFD